MLLLIVSICMGSQMANDVFDGFKYDRTDTVSSPVILGKTLLDYESMVKREGGKTKIADVSIIDMDAIKNSLGIVPTPSSMDIVFIVSKMNVYGDDFYGSKKKCSKYILVDLKFNVTSPNKVDKNISNDSIRSKFKFSTDYIRSKDIKVPCWDVAFFVFNNANFEQIKNCWARRNLNSPKNIAVKQADFEVLFL